MNLCQLKVPRRVGQRQPRASGVGVWSCQRLAIGAAMAVVGVSPLASGARFWTTARTRLLLVSSSALRRSPPRSSRPRPHWLRGARNLRRPKSLSALLVQRGQQRRHEAEVLHSRSEGLEARSVVPPPRCRRPPTRRVLPQDPFRTWLKMLPAPTRLYARPRSSQRQSKAASRGSLAHASPNIP